MNDILGHKAEYILECINKINSLGSDYDYTDEQIKFMLDLSDWHKSLHECKHEKSSIVKRVISNGVLNHWFQCDECGWGRPVKKSETVPVGDWDEVSQNVRNGMWNISNALYAVRKRNEEMEREIEKQNKSSEFWQKWDSHMKSDKWKAIRKKVISRCNGICEGCLVNPVQQVHHVTYAHLGNEFCFELLGLCSECHNRLHDGEEL
jgi:hypothetical protein